MFGEIKCFLMLCLTVQDCGENRLTADCMFSVHLFYGNASFTKYIFITYLGETEKPHQPCPDKHDHVVCGTTDSFAAPHTAHSDISGVKKTNQEEGGSIGGGSMHHLQPEHGQMELCSGC